MELDESIINIEFIPPPLQYPFTLKELDESIINIEFIPPPLQYPFTLIINNHLLFTNGPERNMFSIWSIKTGELFYDLPESEALEKLDLHLPAWLMNDLPSEINFANSTDYYFIYTTIYYGEESSLSLWDLRSDQYQQKPSYFDIIYFDIEEQHRQFWIGYEEENDEEIEYINYKCFQK